MSANLEESTALSTTSSIVRWTSLRSTLSPHMMATLTPLRMDLFLETLIHILARAQLNKHTTHLEDARFVCGEMIENI
jgi:hypothetical protein